MARSGFSIGNPEHVARFVEGRGHELMAISLAAVFFGAMSYIGNGPNFMVKSIAEQAKVKTPGFFAYIVRYAFPLLLPLLVLIALLFFLQ
jgi:Na+/H+ antiporter NhaD/arsenite permease-like protein